MDKPVSLDPLLTAWEVIPYSFVIDWFFNIGSNIQAYSPFASGDLLWSGVAEIKSSEVTFEAEPVQGSSLFPRLMDSSFRGPGALSQTFRSVSRKPADGSLSLNFKPRLSVLKGVDLFALASNLALNVASQAGRGRR